MKLEKHKWGKIQKRYIPLFGPGGHLVQKYRECEKCGVIKYVE